MKNLIFVFLFVLLGAGQTAQAQQFGYIGEIRLFAGNFAPRYWAFCQGQIIPIAQNTALFSILGTTYGGNGTTNFALPDLRGRVPIQAEQGPGLSYYSLGQVSGTETYTLVLNQLPPFVPFLRASNEIANTDDPTGALLAKPTNGLMLYRTGASPNAVMHPSSISLGGNQPTQNRQPYLALNYIICTEGIFPPRD